MWRLTETCTAAEQNTAGSECHLFRSQRQHCFEVRWLLLLRCALADAALSQYGNRFRLCSASLLDPGASHASVLSVLRSEPRLALASYFYVSSPSPVDQPLDSSFYLTIRPRSLVFPRWDVIAIMFSVFLLTYTYIEARAKSVHDPELMCSPCTDPVPSYSYYRGSILCLSYLVLLGGFAWAPGGRDSEFHRSRTEEDPS